MRKSTAAARGLLDGKGSIIKPMTAAEFKRQNCNKRALARSNDKFATLAGMNKVIDAGGSDAINASKAKRKMNDSWKRPVSVNLFEMWNPEGKHYVR